MKNFSTFLKEYRANRHCEEELFPPIMPAIVPASIQKNIDVANFFAGENVYSERITTNKCFSYQAKVRVAGTCNEREFESAVKSGLLELGYEFIDISIKRISRTFPKKADENCEYEVSIKMA